MSGVAALWHQAESMDATLRVRSGDLPALERKQLTARAYSRERLFSRMAQAEPALFDDFPVPVRGQPGRNRRGALIDGIRRGFPRSWTARVQTGRSRRRGRLPVPELMRRWESGRS